MGPPSLCTLRTTHALAARNHNANYRPRTPQTHAANAGLTNPNQSHSRTHCNTHCRQTWTRGEPT
eukprot:3229614-Lingulodinium_polyedra.AAC.1